MSNFGEILKEIGGFGLFQKRLVALLCIPTLFTADVMLQLFTGLSFPHHCNTDWILERGPNLTDERQKNLTLPVNKVGKYESCEMFTPVDLNLETIEAYGINATTECINGSVFEARKGASSIVTEVRSTLCGAAFTPSPTGVWCGEWSDSSKFASCTIFCHSSYPLGLILLSGIAYLIPNWRILQLVVFSPLVVVLGIIYWILPESARWLITQGRKKEAIKEIRRAAKVNGRKVPEDLLDKLDDEGPSKRGSMLDIFRISYLRKRALIMSYVWFGTSLMYYGLSLNAGNFGLDIYLTQFVFAFVEFPARLGSLPLIQHFGRKVCLAGVLMFGGAACLGIIVIPKDLPVVVTIIAVIGKFAATASFSIIYVYSAELYPTILRQNGVGLNSVCARVGGVIAPLIRLLGVYHYSIPMLIYGIVPIVAGGICLLLPETLNVELQDHAEVLKPENGPQMRSFNEEEKSEKSTKM
ncbi:solute carrier family 22 member 13-like isoform X2 [Anoplopoma fimbria]|uniref:solute carrier family 22 member 13-like isoform X2 n=1 Tax=Anoplopoma fimbria TaxID=229290 RepID=UPI0023ED66BB|nr:solute carrier family 22 member 13-like isoform X2 [Anoplopoma fimbria]